MTMNMNNREVYTDLKEITGEILGNNYFQAFKSYFKSFFSNLDVEQQEIAKDQKLYIAFITRRCSCLAYIFLQILREEKDSQINSYTNSVFGSDVTYLTDNSLINKGWEIGKLLLKKEENLPRIILADDSMSYGRAITSIMGQFENQVLKAIEEEADESLKQDAKQRFSEYRQRNISIRVYAEKKQTNLLKPQDAEILRSEIILPHYQWNDLSNRISELINNVNIANAAFVLSRGVNDQGVSPDQWNPEGWEKVDWEYQDHHQTVFFYPVSAGSGKYRAVCSVRCIECGTIDSYRLIPFVFLPALTKKQVEKMEERIFERLCSVSADPDESLQDNNAGYVSAVKYTTFEKLKKNELEHVTLRSRLDFVTMYLSFCMLNVFEEQTGIGPGDEERYDTEKVLWNYSDTQLRYEIVKRLILKDRTIAVFTQSEIVEILSSLDTTSFMEDLSLDKDQEEPEEQKIRQSRINQYLEEYLFELGMSVERAAHEAVLSRSKLGQYTLGSLQKRRYNPFYFFFADVQKLLRKKEIHICFVYELLSSILQMMDAGLMSIASIRMDESQGIGVGQEVRICEQALSVLPRRYMDHADVLMLVERRSSLQNKETLSYLKEYCSRAKDSNLLESSEDAETMAEKMLDYVEILRSAAQKVNYWTVGLKRQFAIIKPGEGVVIKYDNESIRKRREEFASCM